MSPPPTAKKVMTRLTSSSVTLLDIEKLIAASEERIISHLNKKLDALTERVASMEHSMKEIKAVQVQQESDIDRIKDILCKHQRQFEKHEESFRQYNLIFSNIPEEDVTVDGDYVRTLSTDADKVLALSNTILPSDAKIEKSDIAEVVRLGSLGRGKPRVLKVKLVDMVNKNNILRNSRHLNLPSVWQTFGRVYINKDMSYLRRKEERRIRLEFLRLKNIHPEGSVSLRGGKLMLGPVVKDCVDVCNQLF